MIVIEIFSNTTNSPQATDAALPRVPDNITQVPATLPRALPSAPATTTADYFDLTSTNRRLRRQKNRANKGTETIKNIKTN